jgi:hypothetical protein
MFVYYFSGNFIFGLVLNMTVVHWIDRPIYALLNIKKDIKDAEENREYRLNKYLALFKGQVEFVPNSSVVSETDEILQEQLIDRDLKKARFDSGAMGSDAARDTKATTRPTEFGSGGRIGTNALRFSDE